jgi:hypothetical protein
LEELSSGATRGGKRKLKPIEVLCRVQQLLQLGDTLAAVRKACHRPRPVEATPQLIEGIRRIHEAYGFPPEAYAFVGVDDTTLRRAGVLPERGLRDRPSLRRTKMSPRAQQNGLAPGGARQKPRRGAA